MVIRINAETSRERDKLNESNVITAHSYASEQEPSRRSIDNSMSDDVIVSLASAHENRRARQVTEWERMRGANVQTAA